MQTQLEQIEKGAENNISEMRFIESMEIGQFVRQGDIYIHRVPDDHPCGDVTENRQLAFGTTQGSRHILEGDAELHIGTTPPEWAKRALLGPMFRLFSRGTVTHPEHAHISLPTGTYQVTHQMDARTFRRVRD